MISASIFRSTIYPIKLTGRSFERAFKLLNIGPIPTKISRALTPESRSSLRAKIEFCGFFSFDMRPQCKIKTSAPFRSSVRKASLRRYGEKFCKSTPSGTCVRFFVSISRNSREANSVVAITLWKRLASLVLCQLTNHLRSSLKKDLTRPDRVS